MHLLLFSFFVSVFVCVCVQLDLITIITLVLKNHGQQKEREQQFVADSGFEQDKFIDIHIYIYSSGTKDYLSLFYLDNIFP